MNLLFGFIVGTVFASGAYCAAQRYLDGLPWWSGRSTCDACKTPLKPWYLIPLVSFIVYRGRAGCCGAQLSYQYVFIELLGGLFGIVSALVATTWQELLLYTFVICFLLFILSTDVLALHIPEPLTFFATVVLIIVNPLLPAGQSSLGFLVGLSAFAVLRLFTNGKGVGSGDLWLGGFIGALVGAAFTLQALATGYIIGAGYALYLIASKKATKKTKLALGLFLVTGLYAFLVLKEVGLFELF